MHAHLYRKNINLPKATLLFLFSIMLIQAGCMPVINEAIDVEKTQEVSHPSSNTQKKVNKLEIQKMEYASKQIKWIYNVSEPIMHFRIETRTKNTSTTIEDFVDPLSRSITLKVASQDNLEHRIYAVKSGGGEEMVRNWSH